MVLTVNTGRDEAMFMLRAWKDRNTLLRCDLTLVRVACCLRLRIRALSAEKVELFSDDTFGEAVIPLGSDVEFGRGDFRGTAPDDAATYERCLVIYIPVPSDPEHPEAISLIEVKDDA